MRLRKAVESLWRNIGPAVSIRKPANVPSRIAAGQADDSPMVRKAEASSGSFAHASLHMTAKMTAPIRFPIDRLSDWCRLPTPNEAQGFILPRRLRMAIQAHLVELERKHKVLENELHEALLHLSTDDLEIAELKRRKLLVKDQIERLKQQSDETVH